MFKYAVVNADSVIKSIRQFLLFSVLPDVINKREKIKIINYCKMYQFVETRTLTTSANFIEALQRNRSNAARSIIDFPFNNKRLRNLGAAKQVPKNKKAIVYWMSRDQRVEDNWSLLYAQALGLR